MALLVVGVAVPTPGGVGGFHEAFRLGVTAFYGADNERRSARRSCCTPSSSCRSLSLGLWFAAQDGLSFAAAAGCRQADDRSR